RPRAPITSVCPLDWRAEYNAGGPGVYSLPYLAFPSPTRRQTMPRGGWQGPIDIGGASGPRLPPGLPPVPRVPPGALRAVLVAALLLLLFFTGYYQVEPDEVGVVQRFGRYIRTTEPGPHLKLPLAEAVTKVPVQRQLKMEFGFRTTRAAQRSEFSPPTPETLAEAVMLTGDLNVAVVEWIVQFRIKDARAYLFHVRDVPETFRNMSQAAIRPGVGRPT